MCVDPFISLDDTRASVKTIRIPLHVIDLEDMDGLLDIVTDVEGVVAALLDVDGATLDVVVSRDASALHVREQLVAVAAA